jgi:hypothetical protein
VKASWQLDDVNISSTVIVIEGSRFDFCGGCTEFDFSTYCAASNYDGNNTKSPTMIKTSVLWETIQKVPPR